MNDSRFIASITRVIIKEAMNLIPRVSVSPCASCCVGEHSSFMRFSSSRPAKINSRTRSERVLYQRFSFLGRR